MANFTLFLIHGIGVHKNPRWADSTIELLHKAWQRDINLDSQIDLHIDIVPICYDEIFEDYLGDFSELSKGVINDALELNQKEQQHLADTLRKENVTERHFLWSHIADVLLYKMPLVREQITALVAKQIYQKIAEKSTSADFGIIAHSLGTRVINDTLQRMRTEQVDQGNFYLQGYQLKFLMLISDVTDLFGLPLNRDPHPPSAVYARDTFDYLRTVSNRYDPIARMVPTQLNHWPEGRSNETHMGREIYKDILIEHVHETNVHGLTHYMLHPEITDELFDLCGFSRYLEPAANRSDQFPTVGPKVEPGLATALDSLVSSATRLADNSWQTYINLVLKFGSFSMDEHGTDPAMHSNGDHHA